MTSVSSASSGRVAGAATRPDDIRRHNLAVMLGHLHRDGALTRAELTTRLAVSRSTVGALVAELTALGLVREEVPVGGAGVGRPSHVVVPDPNGPFVVAVDVDVASVTIAAVGLGGTVLARETIPTSPRASTPKAVAALTADALARLRASARPMSRAAGVGVSVPGTVDRRTGRIGVAPNLGWHDAHLGELLSALVPDEPVLAIGNDADLAVLAEHRHGSARGCDDVVYLMGRVGVGAGIIVGGVPLRGHNGHAGEIGHNVLDPSGPLCHCEQHGCVETYVGEDALLARAGKTRPVGAGDPVGALFADARRGEESALEAVRGMIDPLGRTVAVLVNTLNPQRVLLGGFFAGLFELAQAELEDALARYALEAPGATVQLVAPALGGDSALLGAAELAFAEVLADPLAAAG